MEEAQGIRIPERGCIVVRVDYGHPGVDSRGRPAWDLGVVPLPEDVGREASPRGGVLIRRAELLLGWSRTRAGEGIFRELQRLSERAGVVLECRFPRHARALRQRMTIRKDSPGFIETPADGALPPLYRSMDPRSELCRQHLEREWWTGMGVARGDVALLRIAFELAKRDTMTPLEVAGCLGVTGGAARSYLRWMEDAALARRSAAGASLRHPLLATLFSPEQRRLSAPPPPRAGRPSSWDAVELD